MHITLVSIDPFSPVLELVIDQFPAVIGCAELRADVHVAAQGDDTQYCELLVRDGVLTVRDLKSKHRTLVNDKPVRRAALESGDTLTIGIRYLQVSFGKEVSVASAGDQALLPAESNNGASKKKRSRPLLAK